MGKNVSNHQPVIHFLAGMLTLQQEGPLDRENLSWEPETQINQVCWKFSKIHHDKGDLPSGNLTWR